MNNWIKFLRQYGPIARNDNMYDETIQRSAWKSGVNPIEFEHPALFDVASSFEKPITDPVSLILTGTAGDGKTHLCRNVWDRLCGDKKVWDSDDPHITLVSKYPKERKKWPDSDNPELFRDVTVHFIRDLSAWSPQHGLDWPSEKIELLVKCSQSFFDAEVGDIFLIAANDGQLVECWRRLPSSNPNVARAREVIEDLLVEERVQESGVRLKLFNLSRWSSTELFDRALESFLKHPGWESCYSEASENGFFSPKCPIRHNYELLKEKTIPNRLRCLLELCDHNGLHIPIRQILILLSNAVLGHEDVKDSLMKDTDIPNIIKQNTISKASLFNNIFGGNLSETRRSSITVFDYFDRFQIGSETSNRFDNIMIFGEADETLNRHFEALVSSDKFYGADERYYAAKTNYIEGTDEDDTKTNKLFMDMLVSQRRGLFFKIPPEQETELGLWNLTVFKFAGEYLEEVIPVLKDGKSVKRPIISRLIQGINRVFSGMLINSDRELFLTTSANNSQAKVSRLLIDRMSVEHSKGERIFLSLGKDSKRVQINFQFSPEDVIEFPLTLTRYEFLSRISTEGALPASFSKECYEDILSLKSKLLTFAQKRNPIGKDQIQLKVLSLAENGIPSEQYVEVRT